MIILNRAYTAQEVSEVLGVPAKNISNWASRGFFTPINKDDLGKGRAREYSWHTLMQIACASAIMELGFSSPQDAFMAASHFAHVGKGQSEGAGQPSADQAVRWPGLPFHHMRGVTMFYFAGNASAVLLHRIWNNEPFKDGYHEVRDRLRGYRAHIALDMTEIFKAVCHRLSVDYRFVLDDAYRGHDVAVNWQRPGQGG